MAVTVAEIQAKLSLTGKEAYTADLAASSARTKAAANQMGTSADQASSKAGGMGAAFGTFAKVAAVAAAAALGAVGAASIKSAASMEQNRVAFETMLGSASAAGKMLKDIEAFALKTPFNLPQVVEGSKALLAYGVSADKIIPTFNALGNIAAGVGRDKLPQLTLAFGQVKAAGQLTGAELRQFTEAGVPLLEVLAKQSGKTAAQVKNDMERGIAPSFGEVESALFSMSQEGGKFFNLMERQSATLSGSFSNFVDTLGKIGRAIVGVNSQGEVMAGSIFETLAKGLTAITDFLVANQATIIGFFTSAQNVMRPFFAAIGEGVAFIAPYIAQLWNYFVGVIGPAIAQLKAAIVEAMPWLEQVFKGLGVYLVIAVVAAAAAIGLLVYAFVKLVTQTIETGSAIYNAVRGYFGNVANFIISIVNIIVSGWNRLMALRDIANNVFSSVLATARGNLSAMIGFMESIPGRALAAGQGLMRAFAQGILQFASMPVKAVEAVVQAVRDRLPGSDAKTGPLSDLTASGRALPVTFAKGISEGMAAVTAAMSYLPTPMGAMSGESQMAGGFGTKIEQNFYPKQLTRADIEMAASSARISVGERLRAGA